MHEKALQPWIIKSRTVGFCETFRFLRTQKTSATTTTQPTYNIPCKRRRASYQFFLIPSHRSTVATDVYLKIQHMPSLLHLFLRRDSDSVPYDTSPALPPSALPPTGLGPGHPLSLDSTCARSTLCFCKTISQKLCSDSRVLLIHEKTLQTSINKIRPVSFSEAFFF